MISKRWYTKMKSHTALLYVEVWRCWKMFLFGLVFAMSLCASVYMCFVVTCWERADLLALVCGVYCEFVTFPLVSWVRCGTWFYRFLIFAPLLTLIWYTSDALFRWRHTGSTYTWRHYASIAYDFNLKLHPVCAVNVLLHSEPILEHFVKQLCLRAIILWNYDVILKTKCKVSLWNLPLFSFWFK